LYKNLLFCLFAGTLAACAATETQTSVGAVEEPPVEVEVAAAEVPADISETVEPAAGDDDGAGAVLPVPEQPQYDPDDVAWIQERLLDLGYYEGAIDGSAGRRTRRAIREYQVDQGIEPDGRPTAEFRDFMWRNGG
jgi:hypothetical protein